MLLLPRLPGDLLRRPCLPAAGLGAQGGGRARGSSAMTEGPSRRRVLTMLGVLAGLPMLKGSAGGDSRVALYRWQGTSLGSPSRLLLYHHDRRAAARVIERCAAEIERLERIFALFRAESEIARLNRDGVLDGP